MSKNTARQTYQAFMEWRNWAIAKKIIKIKKKAFPAATPTEED
jgi:hypothetical protein